MLLSEFLNDGKNARGRAMKDEMLIVLALTCPPLMILAVFWLQEKPRFSFRAVLLAMSVVAVFLGLIASALRK